MSKPTIPSTELFRQLPMPWKPLAYMKKSVKWLLEHACAGLFFDPGMRKTSITLAALLMLIRRGMVDKVLIVAPLRVCYLVWPLELAKWADFAELKMEILHGPKKDEALKRKAHIYVINPEGLDWLTQVKKTKKVSAKTGKVTTSLDINLRRWRDLGFDTLVIDELTMFKHIGSGRFKLMKMLLGTFGRRWGLTGSPAANSLLDLFAQCYVLDQGRSLGPYFTHYRIQHFVSPEQYVWKLVNGEDKKIYKKISPLALRLSAEDYIQMPQLIENTISVDLPEPVREFYNDLEDDLIAGIEDHVVTAANAAVASMKCRQVANGGIFLTQELEITGFKLPKQKREWLNLHTEKVDALADLIDELQGEPIIVAYDFQHDLDRLRQRFGDDLPYIGSGVTPKRSTELERLWNSGKLPYLFGHPQSMAHGLNLQEVGRHVAWHSLTYNYELYDQFIRRVRRSGNKAKQVFCHRIVARRTVDQQILGALGVKERGQQAFFKGLQELARGRKTGV